MNDRRNLLNELCTNFKSTIPPPQWKYLPSVMELGEKEPFKALIEAGPEVTITIDDFTPLLPKLPGLITEIHDEVKARLVQQLAAVSEAGKVLPANCLDLATSVFFCDPGNPCKSDGYVAGTDSIVSHNCGVDTRPPTPISPFYIGYINDNWDCSRNFVVHPAAVLTAKALVRCAGLDPEKALASEMDRKDLRFACNLCVNRKPHGYSWRTAVSFLCFLSAWIC
jgi:hypothetical protein